MGNKLSNKTMTKGVILTAVGAIGLTMVLSAFSNFLKDSEKIETPMRATPITVNMEADACESAYNKLSEFQKDNLKEQYDFAKSKGIKTTLFEASYAFNGQLTKIQCKDIPVEKNDAAAPKPT